MSFRLMMQPAMATFFAVRSGLRDAREGRPAYFWAVLTNPGERADSIRRGWADVGKIFIIAIVLDVIYQVIVIRRVYVGESLITATLLAIVPYLLVRGPATRIARKFFIVKRKSESDE
jgi:hypothetical protein